MKRIIMTWLLACLFLLTCGAALAAESDFVFQVGEHGATLTDYAGGGGDVTVPGWFHGRPVIAIGAGAFEGSGITSVRLPSSVQRIGVGAFRNCGSLSGVSSYAAAEPEGDPHTWDAGVVTTPPTADSEGVMTFTCTGCGDTRTEAIPATGGRVPGDVNGNGSVDNRDVLRLMKYLAGAGASIDESNADVTGDGVVNNRDVLRLMKHLADPSVTLK